MKRVIVFLAALFVGVCVMAQNLGGISVPVADDRYRDSISDNPTADADDTRSIGEAATAWQAVNSYQIRYKGQSAQPSTPAAGWTFYDSDDNKLYLYNGSSWVEISTGGGGVAWGAITGTVSDQTDVLGNAVTNTLTGNTYFDIGSTNREFAIRDAAGNYMFSMFTTAGDVDQMFFRGGMSLQDMTAAGATSNTAGILWEPNIANASGNDAFAIDTANDLAATEDLFAVIENGTDMFCVDGSANVRINDTSSAFGATFRVGTLTGDKTYTLEDDGGSILTGLTTTTTGLTTASNLVTVGALNSGSISSGFGNIDNGSSTLDTGAATVASLTSGGNVVSDTDSTDTLGTDSVQWANAYLDAATIGDGTADGILTFDSAADSTITGASSGDIIINVAATRQVDIEVGGTSIWRLRTSDFYPVTDGVRDLGRSSNYFDDSFVEKSNVREYMDLADSNGTGTTCDSSTRGRMVLEEGAGGVADVLYMCMKNSSDVYSWNVIHTGI